MTKDTPETPEGMIEAEVFAKLRELPEEEIVRLIRDGALKGRQVDGNWYVDKTELHIETQAKPEKAKTHWWLVLLLIGIPAGLALLRYGTLSPCGMLKKEMQMSMVASMSGLDTSDKWEAAGYGLGVAFADKMIDGVIGGMSPLQCSEGLLRWWSEGRGSNLFDDVKPSSRYRPSTSTTPAESVKPKWFSYSKKSLIDDSTNVFLSIDGDKKISGYIGGETPTLRLRCKENRTEAYLSFGMQLDTDYDSNMSRYASLRLRYDDNPAQKTRMDLSTDGEAVFFRKAIPTIKKMLQHNKLLVEVTPYSRGPQVTTFDLTGLDVEIEPLQTACHWR